MRRVLRGRGVASGVAVGRVLRIERGDLPLSPEPIPPAEVESEVARLGRAREAARDEISALRERVVQTLGETCASMLDAQRLILDDPGLLRATERGIRGEGVSASWALSRAVSEVARKFEAIDDLHFRERGGDLEEVHRRLQRLLADRPEPAAEGAGGPAVVVARALGPSDAAVLARAGIVGIATDLGGPTSHAAILAQALGLPAVVGTGSATSFARAGAGVVVDGDAGEIVFDPEPADLDRARARREAWLAREAVIAEGRDLPAATKDGVEVVLRANIEFAEELPSVIRFGARGVGLYRSEFLFLAHAPSFPGEEEHYRAYREIADKVAPHAAVIRTLDLGGEKYFHEVLEGEGETNPVLGLRAVRLCLSRPDVFRPQIRGILRAAAHGDVRVMIPLVTTAEEIREVRRILAEEAESLKADGKPCRGDMPVGIMVETPAAALTADLLARESDFLSLGTNDLIQYALAVDRGNASVAYLYDPLHAAVLRMIRGVAEAGRAAGIPVSLCGEMAADPALAPLLVGLGLRELSMQPRAIGAVRDSIRAMVAAEAERKAEEAIR